MMQMVPEMCMHKLILVRAAGAAGAGGFYPGLGAGEQAMFTQGMQAFMEVDSVSGGITGEGGTGLGPGFNGNSCAQCHAQPAMGGSSPGTQSPQNPIPNPQVALATLDGATNRFLLLLLRTARCEKHASS